MEALVLVTVLLERVCVGARLVCDVWLPADVGRLAGTCGLVALVNGGYGVASFLTGSRVCVSIRGFEEGLLSTVLETSLPLRSAVAPLAEDDVAAVTALLVGFGAALWLGRTGSLLDGSLARLALTSGPVEACEVAVGLRRDRDRGIADIVGIDEAGNDELRLKKVYLHELGPLATVATITALKDPWLRRMRMRTGDQTHRAMHGSISRTCCGASRSPIFRHGNRVAVMQYATSVDDVDDVHCGLSYHHVFHARGLIA